MYQRFVRESSELEPLRAQLESNGALGDPEVEELWARIDARLRRASQGSRASDSSVSTLSHVGDGAATARRRKWRQWGTVRIFISSTFKDFFAERESLVKRVFPSLREWCERHRIVLYDYDLRWGVPKDSTGSDAVRTCLELLDRCLDETGGRAFFLGLVGDRFGWVPGQADLDEELERQYDWIYGSSVTQVEVIHGAMEKLSPNALFMIRNPGCYAALPDALRKDFVEPAGSVNGHHVARQKLEVVKRFPPDQVRQYSVRFAGTVKEGRRERVQFEGLEDFEQRVLTFFKRAITAEFPLHSASEAGESLVDANDDGESNETHIRYMFSLAIYAQGQATCLRLMHNFVEADNPQTIDLPPLAGGLKDASQQPNLKTLVVGGKTGSGKTTALARLGQQFVDRQGYEVMVHFSQFSPTSGNPETLHRKLNAFLTSFLSSKETANFKKDTPIEDILKSVARLSDRRFLILIDAFECLCDFSYERTWLPQSWPNNVRCIVTCLMGDVVQCFNDRTVYLYELEPLEPEACRAVCRGYLDEFGKRLDSAQLGALLGKASATNPLWLTQACEELRLFGDYAAVSQMIADFPEDAQDLLKSIAARILKDNPDGMAAALLALVSVSRVGVWEKYARRILHFVAQRSGQGASDREAGGAEAGEGEGSDELPLVEYLRLRRETKAFLRSITRESVCLTFQHRVSRIAVQELLLAEPKVASRWHSLMVDFILTRNKTVVDIALSRDLSHHLYQSDRRSELHKIMSNDVNWRYILMRIPAFTCSNVYNSWRCPHPKVTTACKQASMVVCAFCKNMPTRAGTPKGKACVYCGIGLVANNFVPTATCQIHQAAHVTMMRCWYCGRMDANASQLSMCFMCSHQSNSMWCSQPILETDRQFPSVIRTQFKRSGLLW